MKPWTEVRNYKYMKYHSKLMVSTESNISDAMEWFLIPQYSFDIVSQA